VIRIRPALPRLLRSLALALALAALALDLRHAWGRAGQTAVFAAAALVSLGLAFFEWSHPPQTLRRFLPRANALALLALGAVTFFGRTLGTDAFRDTLDLVLFGGAILAPIALLFSSAPSSFSPGRTLTPATVGILALAGLDPPYNHGFGLSRLRFLSGAEHSSFAEIYVLLASLVLVALWAAALSESGPRWRVRDVVRVVAAMLAVAAIAATLVVGLPTLQPRVERAIASALDSGQTGLSGESSLGEFAELAASRRRVLDLQSFTLDAKAVDEGRWLLRSEVFTAFDGRRWTRGRDDARGSRTSARVLQPVPAPARAGPLVGEAGAWFRPPRDGEAAAAERPADTTAIWINQHELGRWPLLLPRVVSAVTADAPFLELDRYGSWRRPGGIPLQLYGALLPATASPPLVDLLRLGDDERRESLSLPTALDARVRSLADRLASSGDTPRQRLLATLGHLQNGFTYTLAPGPFHSNDPVAEFLFDKKAAYCEYFATATVVLLRLQQVPARFVKGLNVSPETDQGGGLHVVRESDAHAWIEAWLPGEGWVEADPTPPDQLAAAHPRAGALERLLQRARAAIATTWARILSAGPLAFLRRLLQQLGPAALGLLRQPWFWVLAVAAALGPRLLRRWKRRRRRRARTGNEAAPIPAELAALVREAERRWQAHGRPRPANRGLLEHARTLGETQGLLAPLPAALVGRSREIVDAYYRARFGDEIPSLAEIARLGSWPERAGRSG
jgi:transglutaminase-like putative cysteine protease